MKVKKQNGYWKLNDKEVEFCTLTVEELSFGKGNKKNKKNCLLQWLEAMIPNCFKLLHIQIFKLKQVLRSQSEFMRDNSTFQFSISSHLSSIIQTYSFHISYQVSIIFSPIPTSFNFTALFSCILTLHILCSSFHLSSLASALL